MLLIHCFKNVKSEFKTIADKMDMRIRIINKQLDYMYSNPLKYENRIKQLEEQKHILENGLNNVMVKSTMGVIQ